MARFPCKQQTQVLTGFLLLQAPRFMGFCSMLTSPLACACMLRQDVQMLMQTSLLSASHCGNTDATTALLARCHHAWRFNHTCTHAKKHPPHLQKYPWWSESSGGPLMLWHRSLLVNPPRCDSTNNASSPERPCVCLKYGRHKEGSNVHKAPETIQGGPAGLSNTLTHWQCIDHRLHISCVSPWTSTMSQPTFSTPILPLSGLQEFFLCLLSCSWASH